MYVMFMFFLEYKALKTKVFGYDGEETRLPGWCQNLQIAGRLEAQNKTNVKHNKFPLPSRQLNDAGLINDSQVFIEN